MFFTTMPLSLQAHYWRSSVIRPEASWARTREGFWAVDRARRVTPLFCRDRLVSDNSLHYTERSGGRSTIHLAKLLADEIYALK